MKNIILYILMLTATTTALAETIAKSDYRPQTSWPYLLEQFAEGDIMPEHAASDTTVYITFKQLYNIHLHGAQLQYVDRNDGRIHLAAIGPTQYVELNGRKYVRREGKMMQLLWRQQEEETPDYQKDTELLLHTDGDWQALFRYQGAAYGMDMNTGANADLYNSELVGLDRPLYDVTVQQRGDGREILLENVFYISVKGKLQRVNRKTLEAFVAKEQRSTFRQFCKDNAINWYDTADIIKVMEYVFGKKQ